MFNMFGLNKKKYLISRVERKTMVTHIFETLV